MSPPTFYFAIGSRHNRVDLTTALAVGQRDFLVPAGAALIDTLRTLPGLRVVLDSGAWPPANPNRLSLDAYAAAILDWRKPDGTWGNLAWAAAYDHLPDLRGVRDERERARRIREAAGRTQRDYNTLLGLLADAGAEDAPVVPVAHYPGSGADSILMDMQLGWAGTRADVTDWDGGPFPRPCYGIGGLVPVLAPTSSQTVFDAADSWYTDLLETLEGACTEGDAEADDAPIHPELLKLHLFGIGRPSFVRRSPLVMSFDSSGPAQLAQYGWQKIVPRYSPAFGLSPEKLQRSRAARLAYWIGVYRASAGLPWRRITDDALPDDRYLPACIQLSLDALLAA